MPDSSSAAGRVLLLRHTALADAAGVCYGRLDPALAATSTEDIRGVTARLPAITRVVSSPARRCLLLAESLAQHRDLPLEIDARWQELDFGCWEGMRWDEVPRDELDAWAADSWSYAPGGGESAAQLYARISRALAELREASSDCVVVTHAGPMRAASIIRRKLTFADHFNIAAAPGDWIDLPR